MTDGPIKATGQETGGAYALLDFAVPSDDEGPPPHLHRHTAEAFYVIDGTLSIQLDDREVTARAGSFVFVPPGVVHTFSVQGSTRPGSW
ncbi:MAG TPA: cupin domain-containing protein [Cryptosporangiaceae bacterium]|nr:cupin domain-containing protein [Cryptosporangiaceae bacterium]